jgi:hypothetical protein
VQLDLFRTAEARVLDELRRLDLERLTPLEAMNLLSRMQAMAGGRDPDADE